MVLKGYEDVILAQAAFENDADLREATAACYLVQTRSGVIFSAGVDSRDKVLERLEQVAEAHDGPVLAINLEDCSQEEDMRLIP